MRVKYLAIGAACALALWLGGGRALAQSSMGGVSGTVSDSTGSVVPGATVTLVNDGTNVSTERITNQDGYFVFVNVRPGLYSLTVELSGFTTAKVSSFNVGVNEMAARNITLNVGDVSEVVDVTAQSELLQTSSSELGHIIEERVIAQVPLQGRNFTQLLLLSPGVNPVSTAQGPKDETAVNSIEGNSGLPGGFIANASVMGQQNRSKIYYVDGIVNTSVRSGTYVALPDIDSIQEFKVQSQSDKAEFGGVMGGVVNMASKTGTNRFRGSAFGFFRDEALSARNSFRDVDAGRAVEHPDYSQSQFGVNIGGPIVKDKTFFFASYDGWRYKDFSRIRHILPTDDAWLNGDFSNNFGRTIYNPYTGQPFPGNVIPADLISPTMQQFLRTYMLRPNRSGSEVVNNFNFDMLREQENNSNAVQVRLDHHFSDRDNVFFRWTERRISAFLPRGDVGYLEPDSINRNFGGGWFHTFSPSMILEVRGGLATQPTEDAPQQHPAGLDAQRGLNLPQLDRFQGYIASGWGSPWNIPTVGVQGPRERGNPNWNAAADLTWLKGNHSLKAGFQMLQISRLQTNQFGELRFDGSVTRSPQGTANTGDPLADALLGLPWNVRAYVPDQGYIDFHTSTLSGYVQDQWTVKPNLTLTYGLRYDYVTRVVANYGFQSGPDMRSGEWLLALQDTPPVCADDGSSVPPCLPTPLAQIPHNQFIRVTGEENSVLPPIKDNLGPRLGLSWQITPRTVLRTGYSLMWDSMVSRSQYGQHQLETWGWPQFSGIDTGTINRSGPFQTVDDMGSLPYARPRPAPWNSDGYFNAPDRKNAYSHQWHLEMQRQFNRNLMVSLAYVGSYNGRMEYAGRAAAPKVAAIDPATGRRLTAAERDQLRPWPHMTGTFRYSDDIGMSKYNAFQFKAQHRFSEGLSSILSYTWSRTVDTSSGWFDAENGIGGRPVQNYWDIDDARGISSYDIPHLVTWATVWEVPLGRGKRWMSEGPASWILGNWQVSWMLLARSGQPFTVVAGGDPANLGFTNYSRADLVGDPELDNPTADQWFNVDAFKNPVNDFGNQERNVLRAPGFWNVDLTLQKNVPLGHDRELQLRLEAFNVFNHINMGNPEANLASVNVGRITSMAGRPRQLQFGVRMVF